MNGWLDTLNLWHWLSLAVLLILAERLVARGYLLGAALAALLVGLVLMTGQAFSWSIQIFLFATFGVVFTWLYRKRIKSTQMATDPHQDPSRLVGQVFDLDHALPLGHGTLLAEGQRWHVHCSESLPRGSRVKVIGLDGEYLHVVPLRD